MTKKTILIADDEPNLREALRHLLQWWKSLIFAAHFEGGNVSEWSSSGS